MYDRHPILTSQGRRFQFVLSITGRVIDVQPRLPCENCKNTGRVGGDWSMEDEKECPVCFGHGSLPNPLNDSVSPPKEMIDFVERAMLDYIEKRWPKENK